MKIYVHIVHDVLQFLSMFVDLFYSCPSFYDVHILVFGVHCVVVEVNHCVVATIHCVLKFICLFVFLVPLLIMFLVIVQS